MSVLVVCLAAALPVLDFATNSLAHRLNGPVTASALARFVDYPPGAGTMGFPGCLFRKPFTPNGGFWLADVDFSCVSPWNDSCGAQRAGTLISRRHIIFAKHFPLWKGVRISFVDSQGEVCPCRVEETKALKGCDIMIGLLDYEVTPNVRPAKILPDDYAKYIGDGGGLPIATFNQREEAYLSQLGGIATNRCTYLISNVAATNRSWKSLGGNLSVGDSGNPAFLIIGKEPILLYCLYTGGVGSGPSVFRYRKEIQKAMDELCPGYRLERFDFSKAIQ